MCNVGGYSSDKGSNNNSNGNNCEGSYIRLIPCVYLASIFVPFNDAHFLLVFFVSFHRLRNILCFSVCFGVNHHYYHHHMLNSGNQNENDDRQRWAMFHWPLPHFCCVFIPLSFSPSHILLCYIICSFFSHTFFAQFFFCRFTAECFFWECWLQCIHPSYECGDSYYHRLCSVFFITHSWHWLWMEFPHAIDYVIRFFVYLDPKMSSGNNKPKQAR